MEEELGESAKDKEASIYEDNECFICLQLLQICKTANLKEEGSCRAFVSQEPAEHTSKGEAHFQTIGFPLLKMERVLLCHFPPLLPVPLPPL
eukprot:8494975-Ditylum_brightwellii.AAC.1